MSCVAFGGAFMSPFRFVTLWVSIRRPAQRHPSQRCRPSRNTASHRQLLLLSRCRRSCSPPGLRGGFFRAFLCVALRTLGQRRCHMPPSRGNHGSDSKIVHFRRYSSQRKLRLVTHHGGEEGIIRFPWNMPIGILFFTTRSPRFAAFLSGTRKPQAVQNP